MKKKWYLSFKVRISLIFAGLTFVIVVAMAVVLFTHFNNAAKADVRSAIEMAISVNAGEIKSLVNRIDTAIDRINDNDVLYPANSVLIPDFPAMIMAYDRLPEGEALKELAAEYTAILNESREYFDYCFDDNSESSYLYKLYVDSQHVITYYLGKDVELERNSQVLVSSYGMEEESWYQQSLLAKGDKYWFTLPENTTQLFVAKQLRHQYVEGMVYHDVSLGVVVVGFDFQWITQRINTASITEGAMIWLLDKEDNIIYASNAVANDFHDYDSLQDEHIMESRFAEQDYLLQKTMLDKGLYMVTAVPAEDVSNMSFGTVKIILLVAAAMLSIGILMSVILSIYVVKPVRILAGHMQSEQLVPIEGKFKENDEVGILYRSFNHLIAYLRRLMQDVMEASERKKRAELHALQAQINPHFIYNTLNSISSLELLNGRKEIAGVLSSLSQMIRYNIKDPDSMVTLAAEVKIIKSYESIQRFCYRNAVKFSYEIAPETEELLIPKVIIQPLVENALIHGTRILEHDARIKLISTLEDNRLCIRVWDNGIDADVDCINQYITGQENRERYTDSLGIRNVYERIRLVYGEEADLIYSQDEEGCTVATIYLPLEASQKVPDVIAELKEYGVEL